MPREKGRGTCDNLNNLAICRNPLLGLIVLVQNSISWGSFTSVLLLNSHLEVPLRK